MDESWPGDQYNLYPHTIIKASVRGWFEGFIRTSEGLGMLMSSGSDADVNAGPIMVISSWESDGVALLLR